jgi:hypothetical protein
MPARDAFLKVLLLLPHPVHCLLSLFAIDTASTLYKLLVRVTRCVTSPHVKVCSECLHLLEHDQIISLSLSVSL